MKMNIVDFAKKVIEDYEHCANCKYCKPCKKLNYETHEWEWFDICILFAEEENGWCLYIHDSGQGLCECFTKKE